MQGFIIASLNEELIATEVWNGQVLAPITDIPKFFNSRSEARFELGLLQSKYPESEFLVKKATLTITIEK